MLLLKCWSSIMKMMSPLGVGLILFGLIGGLSGTCLTTWSPFPPDTPFISKSHKAHLSRHSAGKGAVTETLFPSSRTTASILPGKYSSYHQVFKKRTTGSSDHFLVTSLARSSPSRGKDSRKKNSDKPMVVYEAINPENISHQRKPARKRSRVRRPKVKWRPKNKPRSSNAESELSNPTGKYKNEMKEPQTTKTLQLFKAVTESYNQPKVIKKILRNPLSNSQSFQLKSANNSLSVPHLNSSKKFSWTLSSSSAHLPYNTTPTNDITRRKGRKYRVDFIASREDGETEKQKHGPFSRDQQNRTILNSTLIPINKPFNYAYNISAMERGSVHPYDPFGISETESVTQSYLISSVRRKLQKDSNLKNVTIYELLKPRLRTTTESINLWKFGVMREKGSLKSQGIGKIDNQSSKVDQSKSIEKEKSKIENDENPKTTTGDDIYYPVRRNVTNVSISEVSTDNLKDLTSNVTTNTPLMVNDSFRTSQIISTSVLSRKVPNIQPEINNAFPEINRSQSPQLVPKSSKSEVDTASTVSDESQNLKEIISSSFLSRLSTNDTNRNFMKLPVLKSTKFAIKIRPDSSKFGESLPDSDGIREAKMENSRQSSNITNKQPRIDQKTFYESLMKLYNSSLQDSSMPEFRPGSFFHYSDIYKREPVLGITRPDPFFRVRSPTTAATTTDFDTTPTTFESRRTSVRVMSTFYPNRMRDATMRFGNIPEPPTTLSGPFDSSLDQKSEEELDDAEYRDALDPGFTMEKLAFLLIGTCCGLSILCLCVVVIAIKCRRLLVEKKLKEHFRRRMYQHETLKEATNPWQQQLFDHFLYVNRRPESSGGSSAHSCNCHCVTWSLGARNLEVQRQQLRGPSRSSLFLNSQKKLPFGAASTLRYESMLGRKRGAPSMCRVGKNEPHLPNSSPEHDSLEQPDSDSQDSHGSKQCTCIDYTLWPVSADVLRGMNRLCPTAGRYVAGDCSHHVPMDDRPLPMDCPPPVTGSNYLDRSEGVVYWSSNNERLI